MKKNPQTDREGNKIWRNKKGQLHRTDGPATIYKDGSKVWYQNDKCHRTDGPAIIYNDGSKFWYQNNKRHRIDGPAVMWKDGREYWYINGKEIDPIPKHICYWRKKLDEE